MFLINSTNPSFTGNVPNESKRIGSSTTQLIGQESVTFIQDLFDKTTYGLDVKGIVQNSNAALAHLEGRVLETDLVHSGQNTDKNLIGDCSELVQKYRQKLMASPISNTHTPYKALCKEPTFFGAPGAVHYGLAYIPKEERNFQQFIKEQPDKCIFIDPSFKQLMTIEEAIERNYEPERFTPRIQVRSVA